MFFQRLGFFLILVNFVFPRFSFIVLFQSFIFLLTITSFVSFSTSFLDCLSSLLSSKLFTFFVSFSAFSSISLSIIPQQHLHFHTCLRCCIFGLSLLKTGNK